MKKKPSRIVIWSTIMVLSLAISFFYNTGILAWPYNNYSDSWGRPTHYDGTGLVGYEDKNGTLHYFNNPPNSHYVIAFFKWGFALIALIYLWCVIGEIKKSKASQLLWFIGILGTLLLVAIVIIMNTGLPW